MRFILRYLFFVLLICGSHILNAQREANIWYFGNFMGLDFNSGAPVPLNDGQINNNPTEGNATISDANGNLLFYTDGLKVWNRLHQVMPNGTNLFGSITSTQSAIIVPFIGDPVRYYVFTVDGLSGPRGLTYSVVNMTLDNGKGDIETKNIPLILNVVEKITAIRHCNNRDIWVLTHGSVSNAYYAFLVTQSGISLPVTSNTGSVLPGVIPPSPYDSSSMGYMKASPDGKKIAAAHWTVNADISDFDNATGVVSNTYGLFQPSDPHYLIYGIEFSPNSQLVYTTVFYTDPVNAQKKNALFQFDVSLATPPAVRASKQVISQNSDLIQSYAALQVATDGKLYMAKNSYKHLAAVNNPNVYGPGCGYVNNAIAWTLPAQVCSFGLPTFIQSYFYPPDSFTYVVNCPGLSVNFNYPTTPNTTTILWNFGDPASGANNTSTLNNPLHLFSAPGVYNVELIKFTNCGPDTLRKQVSTAGININLGADTLVCGGTSLILNSSAAGSTNTFLWQDGSTNPTYTATTAGLYWVQATNSLGCTAKDSIAVTFKPIPVFSLGNDTSICINDTLHLNATVTGATNYLWSNGATTPTINTYQAGLYWCMVNREGCIYRDTLIITAILPKPVVNLGNDTTACGTGPITLNATNPNSSYLWQNASTNPTFTVTSSGLYWVQVTNNNGCIKRDSINISLDPYPVFNLGPDTDICQGDVLTLNATVTNATSYQWSTGTATTSINVSQPGLYWCQVTRQSCAFRDSMTVLSIRPSPVVNLGNDQTLCEGITTTLDATYLNSTYLWQDGSTNPTYTVGQQGTYTVKVNYNGCERSDTVRVNYNLKPRFTLGSDQFICPGNSILLDPTLNPTWQLRWQDGSTAPTYTVTQPGIYSLAATNNCGTTQDVALFTKGICKVYIPSGFTPNGDGLNDLFRVTGVEVISEFNLKIFNRWGQIIFETNDKTKGWDGKLEGTVLSTGTFVYILKYTESTTGLSQTSKGTVTLIR
jgi:gliding motility-associated-like protein